MRKCLLLMSLLLSFYLLKAQESKWGISFTPALVQSPAIHYGVQPGIEYRINDRLSILTDFAFTTGKDKDSSYNNSKYFRIKPELRYLLRNSKWGPSLYGGLQMSFSYRKWNDLNGGCYFNSNSTQDSLINYGKATITSPILTSSLQFGILYSLGEHFTVDFFAGLGTRTIFTHYSDIENSTTKLYNRPICRISMAPDPAYWFNSTVTRFHTNAGFRLIYRF